VVGCSRTVPFPLISIGGTGTGKKGQALRTGKKGQALQS
jgi:hypothetical protein